MKRIHKSIVISLVVFALYIGSYAFWRGPAGIDQCDHPYQVDLPNNIATDFYYPLIALDRYVNGPFTEINIAPPTL